MRQHVIPYVEGIAPYLTQLVIPLHPIARTLGPRSSHYLLHELLQIVVPIPLVNDRGNPSRSIDDLLVLDPYRLTWKVSNGIHFPIFIVPTDRTLGVTNQPVVRGLILGLVGTELETLDLGTEPIQMTQYLYSPPADAPNAQDRIVLHFL